MSTFISTVFTVAIIYACLYMVSSAPEPRRLPDHEFDDGLHAKRKPVTPIKIYINRTAVKRANKTPAPLHKETKPKYDTKRRRRSSQYKDRKAKSSSSTLTIGCPILFMVTPFVVSKFLH
ncbi:MEG-7 [Schistosoma japonicum]|nr:MEG-7 [Schistosoma japonicum]